MRRMMTLKEKNKILSRLDSIEKEMGKSIVVSVLNTETKSGIVIPVITATAFVKIFNAVANGKSVIVKNAKSNYFVVETKEIVEEETTTETISIIVGGVACATYTLETNEVSSSVVLFSEE